MHSNSCLVFFFFEAFRTLHPAPFSIIPPSMDQVVEFPCYGAIKPNWLNSGLGFLTKLISLTATKSDFHISILKDGLEKALQPKKNH